MRFFSVTSPANVALIGPIFSTTVAASSVSDFFSRLWQPGMHAFSTSGSLSASHTFCTGAAMRSSPSITRAMSGTSRKDWSDSPSVGRRVIVHRDQSPDCKRISALLSDNSTRCHIDARRISGDHAWPPPPPRKKIPLAGVVRQSRQSRHDGALSRALPQFRPDARGTAVGQADHRHRPDRLRPVALQPPPHRARQARARGHRRGGRHRVRVSGAIRSRKPASARPPRSTATSPISAWSRCSTAIRSTASC